MANALRLWAAYGGSCALALWAAHRCLLPLSRRAAAGLLLLPLLLTGRAVLEGGFYGALNIAYASAPLHALSRDLPLPESEYRNGHLSDVAIEMVPWRKAVREAVKTGHAPLLNRFILSGDILLAASQPAVFHPSVWIGFLLPLAQAWTFDCAFTLFLASLFAFLFLREIGTGEPAAYFGSAVWMVSNLIVILQGFPQNHVLSALPLLVFGLLRIARETPGGFASMVLALVLMSFGGHPETMLHGVAGAGVLFLFELAFARRPFRAVFRALGAGALAAGLTAVAILPFFEALRQTNEKYFRDASFAHARKSVTLRASGKSLLAAVYPHAYDGVPAGMLPGNQSYVLLTYGYAGGLAAALALAGLAARRREKWGLLAVGLASIAVAAGFPGLTDVVTRLPFFDIAINEHFIGVAVFCLASLAALGLDAVLTGVIGARKSVSLILGAAAAVLAIGLLWRGRLVANGVPPAAHDRAMLLSVGPVLVFALLVLLLRSRPAVLAAGALALLLAVRVVEMPRLYATFPSRLFYPLDLEELKRLPRSDEPYRTAGLGYSMVPNQSALWELEDPRGYEAMTNRRYFETYPLWCVEQPVWFNRIDDPTRPFLSFLNVRFALSEPGASAPAGWRDFARGDHCAIFENPAALARAFAPERIRFAAEHDDVVEQMKSCADFSRLAWIEAPSEPPGERPNGKAVVKVARDGPDLRLDVAASSDSWIVASQTAWKGWKAYRDGERIPLFLANHAFLACRVPAGKHVVRLVYRPDSFTAGLAISGTSMLAVAGAGFFRRRRRRGSGG